MNSRIFFSFFNVLFFPIFVANAQTGIVSATAKQKPTMVILGSYHMSNPGLDVAKSQAVNVLTPERQKQIAQVIERLKKFKPTKIAVEVNSVQQALTQDTYQKYLKGDYQISKNEAEQIGFVLAKALRHEKIYCVDWNGYPVGDLANYDYQAFAENDAESKAFLKGYRTDLQHRVTLRDEKILSLSVAEQLVYLNQPSQIEESHTGYFNYLRIGRGSEYVGANYLSHWYGRNMKIFANLIRIVDSPGDRILVIYGSGHTKLLSQFAVESGYFHLESPLQYLNDSKHE